MNLILPKNKEGKKKTRIVWRGFIIRIFVLVLIVVIGYFGFLIYKINQLQKSIVVLSESGQSNSSLISTAKSWLESDKVELKGASNDRVNILLLGMGGEGHKGKYLTDTIMLVSINPQNYQTAMLSIPRDLYVEIPDSKVHTKINAIYTYELKNQASTSAKGFSSIKKAVENVTGQEVHYYVALDFDGFKEIIDELGGVDVEVEHDIYDSRYPGPNYSYETFEISKGFHHLDAETALKYARVRHTQGGDFGRAARQQQVLAAAKKKAFSLGTLMNPQKINSLVDILGQHLKTDIAFSEIPGFIHLAKSINIYQTTNKVLDAWSADSLLASSHVELGGVWAYVLLPRAKNYSQIYALAENIFQLDQLERKRKEIEKEQAQVLIIPQNYSDYHRISSSFRKLGYETTIKTDLMASPCLGKDEIYSYSKPAKLFTLDDLADKLDTQVTYLESDFDYDIAVCISDKTADQFGKHNQKQEEEKYIEQSIISEDGKVLIDNP